jgi:putative membrane protein
MKRLIQFTAALALTVAVGACNNARTNDNHPAGSGGAVAGTTGSSNADRDFVEKELAMGNAEIELGRLAQQKGNHADVKEFGAMMVRDHQAAAADLKPIAAKLSTTQAEARENHDNDLRDTMEDLQKLSGRDFDKKYISEMIDDHEKDVRDLEKKAENASNADVKAWASKTLPTVRQHLERAKSIKETLDHADDTAASPRNK